MLRLMSRFTIRTNIIAAFVLLLSGVAGLGIFTLQKFTALDAATTDIAANWLPGVEALGTLLHHSEAYRRLQAAAILATDDTVRKDLSAEAEQALADWRTARQAYEPMISAGEERVLADDFTAKWSTYVAQTASLAALGGTHAATEQFDRTRMLFRDAVNSMLADLRLNTRQGQAVGRDAQATGTSGRLGVEVSVGALAALCACIGSLLIYSISAPIRAMSAAMRRIADKETGTEIPGISRRDEIGDMAAVVRVFGEGMVSADRMAAKLRDEQVAKEGSVARLAALIAAFEAKASALVSAVASAAAGMETTAQSLSSTSAETTQQAATVAAAAEEASAGVQTVASAAEQLAASIAEITRQVAQSSRITSRAVEETRRTDGIVNELSVAAEKIGQVVGLITSIAGQTNLLALNATIEAARAGDAGKGFAVVASEVKGLAGQTAMATEQIGAQISQIQAATREAVAAIRGIGQTINEVSAIATSIASAVEEQGAATAEIARNVNETARAAADVTSSIGSVSTAATTTGAAAGQVRESSAQLSRHADNLSAEVLIFVQGARAA